MTTLCKYVGWILVSLISSLLIFTFINVFFYNILLTMSGNILPVVGFLYVWVLLLIFLGIVKIFKRLKNEQ